MRLRGHGKPAAVTAHVALFVLDSARAVATVLRPLLSRVRTVSDFLLPVLVFSIPVLAVVFLALGGKALKGSCGGVGPGGDCGRCGKSADAIPAPGERGACP